MVLLNTVSQKLSQEKNGKGGTKMAKKKKFTFSWEGGLSELKEKFTSVELQHKVSEWRIENAMKYLKRRWKDGRN